MSDERFDDNEEALTVGANTYLFDTTDATINSAEFVRLLKQDKCMNEQMDLFPDGYEPDEESAILDIACGPGGWIREVAREYPHIILVGIDNNKKVIEYASNNEETAHNPNVSFDLMNVHGRLDFEDASFDFINVRFITGVLSTNEDEWLALIKECYRLLRPGGFLRFTESEMSWVAHAPVTNQLLYALMQVMWKGNKTFSHWQIAITPLIGKFFEANGLIDARKSIIAVDYSFGTSAHAPVMEDSLMAVRVARNALIGIGGIPKDQYDAMLEEMVREMKSEEFSAIWPIVVTEGRKPLN